MFLSRKYFYPLSIFNNIVIKGSSWVTVESPSPEAGAVHVAVGVNVVWAVTKDHKVSPILYCYTCT